MIKKFKDGDIVQVKKDTGCMAARRGAVAKVRSYFMSGNFEYVYVNWDRNNTKNKELLCGQVDGGYYENDFELVFNKEEKIKGIDSIEA